MPSVRCFLTLEQTELLFSFGCKSNTITPDCLRLWRLLKRTGSRGRTADLSSMSRKRTSHRPDSRRKCVCPRVSTAWRYVACAHAGAAPAREDIAGAVHGESKAICSFCNSCKSVEILDRPAQVANHDHLLGISSLEILNITGRCLPELFGRPLNRLEEITFKRRIILD